MLRPLLEAGQRNDDPKASNGIMSGAPPHSPETYRDYDAEGEVTPEEIGGSNRRSKPASAPGVLARRGRAKSGGVGRTIVPAIALPADDDEIDFFSDEVRA